MFLFSALLASQRDFAKSQLTMIETKALSVMHLITVKRNEFFFHIVQKLVVE